MRIYGKLHSHEKKMTPCSLHVRWHTSHAHPAGFRSDDLTYLRQENLIGADRQHQLSSSLFFHCLPEMRKHVKQ